MTSSGGFSKLALILISNLFIQLHTADAEKFVCGSTIRDQVQNALSTVCNTTDSELICDKAIGFFLTKVEKDCTEISNRFCYKSIGRIFQSKNAQCGPPKDFVLELFLDTYTGVFERTCRKTKPQICSMFDEKNLKKICVQKLAYFEEIGSPETRNGNETTLCYLLPNTIREVCNVAVEQGCEAIKMEQPELQHLVPDCKEHLWETVCKDMVDTIERIVDEKQNGVLQNTFDSIREDPADCLYEHRKRE